MHGTSWKGDTQVAMKFSADCFEEDDAAAVTMCLMSSTSRVWGSMRRSLVIVLTIPPVAVWLSMRGIKRWMMVRN